MKKNAKQRYADKVQVIKTIWLHKVNDADILEKISKQASVSSYIKRLIRKDIEKGE